MTYHASLTPHVAASTSKLIGWNYRATLLGDQAAPVDDGKENVFCNDTRIWPSLFTNDNGISATAGWSTGPWAYDHDVPSDPRLAGSLQRNGARNFYFTGVPGAVYRIRGAFSYFPSAGQTDRGTTLDIWNVTGTPAGGSSIYGVMDMAGDRFNVVNIESVQRTPVEWVAEYDSVYITPPPCPDFGANTGFGFRMYFVGSAFAINHLSVELQ